MAAGGARAGEKLASAANCCKPSPPFYCIFLSVDGSGAPLATQTRGAASLDSLCYGRGSRGRRCTGSSTRTSSSSPSSRSSGIQWPAGRRVPATARAAAAAPLGAALRARPLRQARRACVRAGGPRAPAAAGGGPVRAADSRQQWGCAARSWGMPGRHALLDLTAASSRPVLRCKLRLRQAVTAALPPPCLAPGVQPSCGASTAAPSGACWRTMGPGGRRWQWSRKQVRGGSCRLEGRRCKCFAGVGSSEHHPPAPAAHLPASLTVASHRRASRPAACHFLWYSGRVRTPLLVQQDAAARTMRYRLPQGPELSLFPGAGGACGHLAALEGCWRVEPGETAAAAVAG